MGERIDLPVLVEPLGRALRVRPRVVVSVLRSWVALVLMICLMIPDLKDMTILGLL
jgi:hypothetical protein